VHVPKSVFTESYALLLEMLVRTRKEAGLSQVQLARKLKRPQPFVSYIERGERRIDVVEFYAIMRALGVDPERAFSELVRRLPTKVEI
jgi:transcriptional regulator with XRE-family HTH domain